MQTSFLRYFRKICNVLRFSVEVNSKARHIVIRVNTMFVVCMFNCCVVCMVNVAILCLLVPVQ